MTNPSRILTIVCIFFLVALIGCAEKIPVQPPAGTGTVFQRTLEETQVAVKNALNKANFGILQESSEYIEAIHLKPGETIEKSKGELVGIWFKDRGTSVVVLIDTAKNVSEVATQKDWEKPLIAAVMDELK